MFPFADAGLDPDYRRTGVSLDVLARNPCRLGQTMAQEEARRYAHSVGDMTVLGQNLGLSGAALTDYVEQHTGFREHVFVGCQVGLIEGQDAEGGHVFWKEAKNVAPERFPGRRQFYVDGKDLRDTFVALRDEVRRSHGVPQGLVLWHSHLDLVGPSSYDIRAFPETIFDIGAVYTVRASSDRELKLSSHGAAEATRVNATRTGTTRFYKADGKLEFVDD